MNEVLIKWRIKAGKVKWIATIRNSNIRFPKGLSEISDEFEVDYSDEKQITETILSLLNNILNEYSEKDFIAGIEQDETGKIKVVKKEDEK